MVLCHIGEVALPVEDFAHWVPSAFTPSSKYCATTPVPVMLLTLPQMHLVVICVAPPGWVTVTVRPPSEYPTPVTSPAGAVADVTRPARSYTHEDVRLRPSAEAAWEQTRPAAS